MFKTLKRRKKRSKNHSIKRQRGGGAMLGKSEGTPEKRLKKYAAQLKIDLKKDNNEVKEFKKQLAEWERLNALAQEEEDMEAPEKFLDWFDKTAWRAQAAEAKAATLAASGSRRLRIINA